jgi:hypothetical protein
MTELEQAQRALEKARTELENGEHGGDQSLAEQRYIAALRTRNIARRLHNRAQRAQRANGEMKIVVLEGEDLIRFHDMIRDLDRMINDGSISTLRVAVDGEGVKAKPEGASWSPGFGFLEVN